MNFKTIYWQAPVKNKVLLYRGEKSVKLHNLLRYVIKKKSIVIISVVPSNIAVQSSSRMFPEIVMKMNS